MTATRQGTSSARIKSIITQRIASAIKAITVYEANPCGKEYQQQDKRQKVARAYTARPNKKIGYVEKLPFYNEHSRIDKSFDGTKVEAKDEIIASTWNLVDKSLTSAEFSSLSVIVPSTLDTKLGNFMVYNNASHNGLSVIMMQKEKVIAYNPQKLEVPEKNYPTPDLEIGEIVFSFKIWERYLYDIKLTMFTTYKSLQHILDQREMNMRPRNLLKLPSNYNGETRYRPGKANVVAERSELSLLG
ncbi:putative reverse transcriptase domain-containing protein [Tanacetum coccineum]